MIDRRDILIDKADEIHLLNPPYIGNFHSRYDLFFCANGKSSFFVKDSLYLVEGDGIILVPPNTIHANIFPSRHYQHLLVNFSDYYINPALKDELDGLFNSGQYRVEKDDKSFFTNIINDIYQANKSQEAYKDTLLRTYFDQMFIKLIRTKEQFSKKNYNALFSREVAKSIEYINQNYMNSVRLEDLSDLLHITPSHFSRTFKKDLGITFIQYLIYPKFRFKLA